MPRMLLVSLAVCWLLQPALAKPEPATSPNVPQARQGGDTVADALLIPSLPFQDTGTTSGYTDDYDEVCPYTGSTSPDVVYRHHGDTWAPCDVVDIDLLGSSYDTKLYVYDAQLNLLACNDDFYSDYVSRLEQVAFLDGHDYFIVIDGYGGDHGDYQLAIETFAPCYVDCPPGFSAEGEVLSDGVDDLLNSGCDGNAADPPLQTLPAGDDGTLAFCGNHGWHTVDGVVRADVDWFRVIIGAGGVVEGTYQENLSSSLQVFAPGGCDDLELLQTIAAAPCYANPLVIESAPGTERWLRIATPDQEPPCGGNTPQAWDYTLELSGLQAVVGTRPRSWSTVKAMFR